MNEVDLKSLWKEFDVYEKEIQKESSILQEVWIKISQLQERNKQEAEIISEQDEFQFLDLDTEIALNIGGQIFETTVDVLTRDPYSILAACCRRNPIILPDPNTGIIYINRDWWLFRHILAFLRSNVLPNELEALKELYTEASFYRLESLQRAIENYPLSEIVNYKPEILLTGTGQHDSTIYRNK